MTTTPQDVQPKLREMVRRIVEGFSPEKVILFGSYARGEATEDSDVDLLVVLKGITSANKLDRTVEVRLAVRGMGVAKDIILMSPEELERQRDIVGTIAYDAVREGKLLYGRGAA